MAAKPPARPGVDFALDTSADDQPRAWSAGTGPARSVYGNTILDKPPARPTIQPTEPGAPATIDRPETTKILGIDPKAPLIAPTPEDDPPIPIAGGWLRTPPARPRIPPPDFTVEPAPHQALQDVGGLMADRPPARPAIPPVDLTLRPAEAHADAPAPIAGEQIDRPFGFSDPAWKSVSVYGSRPLRPEDSKVPRLTVDVQPSPPTQFTLEPAPGQLPTDTDAFRLNADRSQDTTRIAPAAHPAPNPATKPTATSTQPPAREP
jgi:hypothetical protein